MTAGIVAAVAAAVLAVGVPPPPGPGAVSPREAFDRGRTAFGRAEYKRSIEILYPLLYPEVLLDSEGEVVQAHRMLGIAYLFENQQDDARREFRKLLELRPDYRFDPLLDPQRVVDFFNRVVKEEEATVAIIEARRKQREQELALRRQREAARIQAPPTILRYERHSFVLNFVPFGAGQFQNGQPRKGWFFLGTELGLGAISVGAFVANFALYGVEPHRGCNVTPASGAKCPPDQIDHTDENRSKVLLDVQLVTGGLFFATAIWGVVDAIRHYQRDVPLTAGDGDGRGEGGIQLMMSPTGIGAAWRF
jgi:hypothetical protein